MGVRHAGARPGAARGRGRDAVVLVVATLMLGACDSGTEPVPLAFTVQPEETQGGETITPAVQVAVRDPSGAIDRDAIGEVVLALGTNPSGGKLSGSTRVAIVEGRATFSDLSIDRPGTYTLVATSDGFASARSAAFAIRLTFATLSVGSSNTCATTIAGATYCWGANENGQLGTGDTTKTPATIPVLVTTEGRALHLAEVRAAFSYACGLTDAGAAYCWGLNEYASLGIGTSEGPRECSPGFSCSTVPLPVVGGLTFTTITSAGFNCGLTSSDETYCWGLNNVGQLVGAGVPHGINSPTPVLLSGGPGFVAIALGSGHGCGLTVDHAAYCWGNNVYQSADGTYRSSPTPIPVPGGFTFETLHAGQGHNCGITETGTAYCWFGNATGEIGDGTVTHRFTPVPVMGGLRFVTISGGWNHTCGVTPGGAAYCWGYNAYGQLGDGTTTDRHTPVAAAQGLAFVAIGAGRWHTCGRTASGAVYCWGQNDNGELGDGTTTASLVPVHVVQ